MAQPRGRANKVNLLIDGETRTGLTKCGPLSPEEGELTVSELKRKYRIGDGQVDWPPIEAAYLNKQDNGARDFFFNWFFNKELHDVTYQKIDGHNFVYEEYLLPDTELLFSKLGVDYDADSVAVDMILIKMAFYEPIILT